MRAAWYEKQGPPADSLSVGEMADPSPGPGEVRVRVQASGVNPGDVKKRQDTFGVGMPYPRVIPHSDGAGVVDAVGTGVDPAWVGRRVWCFGAQSYRPFGTAGVGNDPDEGSYPHMVLDRIRYQHNGFPL